MLTLAGGLKVLATKPSDLSPIPRTHAEVALTPYGYPDLHEHTVVHTHTPIIHKQ